MVDIDLLIKAKAVLGTAQTEITKFLNGVEEKVDDIDKKGKKGGASFGDYFKGGATVAAGAVTAFVGIVASATAAIVAIGKRGSGLDDIAESFAQMTRDVGGAEQSLKTLRTATDGVVGDMKLMDATNKAFSLGLRLNQDEMKLTGEAARVLANRVGVDAATAYSSLTMVMASGQDKQLKQIGLNIDAKKATEDFARALGVEATELNEAQQIAAKKAAVLAQLRVELEESGRASLSFSDKLDRLVNFFTNLNDKFAVAVATSPVLNELLNAVGDAITGAFGEDASGLVETLIGKVETFAMFLLDVGKVGVFVARDLNQAWNLLKMVFAGTMSVVSSIGLALANLTVAASRVAEALPGVAGQFRGMGAEARQVRDFMQGVQQSFHDQAQEAYAGVKGNDAFSLTLDRLSTNLGDIKARMLAARGAQVETGKATDDLTRRKRDLGGAVDGVNKFVEALNKKLREMNVAADTAAKNGALESWARANSGALEKLAIDAAAAGQALEGNLLKAFLVGQMEETNKQMLKVQEDYFKEVEELEQKQLEAQNKRFMDAMDLVTEADAEASAAKRKRTMSDLDFKMDAIMREEAAELKKLRDLGYATDANVSSIQAKYAEKMRDAREAHNAELDKMKAGTNSWANLTKGWLDRIPGLLQAAFTGGGGLGGAMKGLLSGVGGDIGNKLFGGPNGLGQKVTTGLLGKVGGALAGKIGGMVGMLGGPIGSMLGSLAGNLGGKLFGKLFGGEDKKATKEIKALSGELTTLYGGMENIRLLSKATGVDMEDAFRNKGKKGLEEFKKTAEEFKGKVEELRGSFSSWAQEATAAHLRLPESMTPYLGQLEQMGLLTAGHRAELEKWSKNGQVDVEAMKAAADRYGISLAALGPAFQQGVADQSWQQIIDDLAVLEQGGVDINAVLGDMADEISKLVQDSIQFGTTIPGNMRPWIERLIETGQLVDANGNKITDVGQLKFGETILSSLEKMIEKFDILLRGLGLIPQAIAAIPRDVDIDVNLRERYHEDDRDRSGSGGDYERPGAAAGGLFARPTMRVIAESRPEIVGQPNVIVDALSQAMEAAGGMTGSMSPEMLREFQAMSADLREMSAQLQGLPISIARSVRDGVLLAR